MKHKILKMGIANFLLLAIIAAVSCQKETIRNPPPRPCSTCNTQQPLRTVKFIVDNWVKVSDGKYKSDFYDMVKRYANNFSKIVSVTADTGQGEMPIEPGSSFYIINGVLLLSGEILYFTSYTAIPIFSYMGQFDGQTPKLLTMTVTLY
jgi:hypothetical protein